MIDIKEGVSLKAYNTFGLEAKACYFSEANSLEQLLSILKSDVAKNNPLFIIGGGSNILLTKDIDALVIKMNINGISTLQENSETALIESGAGENWHQFVLKTIEMECYGLENLSLIPGCVGASPMQNIGAYGTEIKDHFLYLDALNLETLTIERFDKEACEFGYRESVFKGKLKGKYIIVKVAFELSKKPNVNTSYGAIEAELKAMQITNPSPKHVSDAVIAIRRSKLPDPAEIGNSGSFFKNPVVNISQFNKLQAKFPEIAHYKVDDNNIKLAAGWLIDQSGWKGKTINNTYGVHNMQALVLVNYGGATGSEIYDLSTQIIESVKERYGVQLEREVNIL
ncbi:MAG: UDP-N-acetylmuramate dehydrogenase [Flavobacteriales bacterium]|jgi:UDP-N-acetylmuramate dehydrogenase